MEREIVELLGSINRSQQQIIAGQREAMEFLRAEAETTRAVRAKAFAVQRAAVTRAKRVLALVVPLIAVCAFLVVYLITKYRIL